MASSKRNRRQELKTIPFIIKYPDFVRRLTAEGVVNHCYYCGQGYFRISENPHFRRYALICMFNVTFCIFRRSYPSIRSFNDRICKRRATTYSSAVHQKSHQFLWKKSKKKEFDVMSMLHRELRDYLQHRKKYNLQLILSIMQDYESLSNAVTFQLCVIFACTSIIVI